MAMTFTQYLLSKLAEECQEVAKEALKGQQQGLMSTHRGRTNQALLCDEILDFHAILHMLEQHTGEPGHGEGFNRFRIANMAELNSRIDKRCYYAYLSFQNGFTVLSDWEEEMVRAGALRWQKNDPNHLVQIGDAV